MARKKSLYTVKQATAESFKAMAESFHMLNLVQMVRAITVRPHLTDGTISRRLRELRDEQPEIYGYRCIDSDKSIYQKMKMTKLKAV